jgi:hypothetical protein
MQVNSHAFPVMVCSTVVGLHPRSLSKSRVQLSCSLPGSSFNKLSRRYVAEETETNESSDSCGCSGSGSDRANFGAFDVSEDREVTGVTGLVGDDNGKGSVSCGLDENSLDATARGSDFEHPASPDTSASKPIARQSEEESIDVFSIGGRLLELRRGTSEGAEITKGEIEPGVFREVGEDWEGESRASKYGEDDDDDENSLEDLSEDTDFFENKAVRDGRFTLIGFILCELGSDGN